MSTTSLQLKDIKFEINREDIDSFLIAALKLFLSCDKFIDSTIKAGLKCANTKAHQCTVSSLYKIIEQAKTHQKINTQSLRQALADLHHSEDKFSIESSDWDIVEAISSIFNMIHLKAMNYDCTMLNEEALSVNCNESCPFHSNFYFGIDEEYLCKCGNRNMNPWDYTNSCQFFNVSDIFEDYSQEISESLLIVPKFLIKRDSIEGNSKIFLNKIINNLKEKLINAKVESCFLDDCPIQNSKISFTLTKCPEYYMINCIWDNMTPPYLHVMLATAAASPTLMLNEIYGVGPKIRYNLKGIIFQKNSRFEYACRYGDKWNFKGIQEDSGWIELLQEVTVLKFLPVLLVYQKAPISQPYDFNVKLHKLTYVEKFAYECQEYEKLFKNPVLSYNEMSSKLFMKPKKLAKAITNTSNLKSEIVAKDFTTESVNKIQDNKALKNPETTSNPLSFTNESNLIYESKNLLGRVSLEPKILNNTSEAVKTPQKYDFYNEKSWKCKCGNTNDDTLEVCGKCYEIKQGVKGWVCKYCKSKNDPVSKIICSNCGSGNEENFHLISIDDKYKIDDRPSKKFQLQYKQEMIPNKDIKDVREIDLRGLNEKRDKTYVEDERKELEKNKIIHYRKEKELKRQKELEQYEAEKKMQEIRDKGIMRKYMESENQNATEIKEQEQKLKKRFEYEDSTKAQMMYSEPKNPGISSKKEEIVNIWECKCGSSNMDDWEICQKCNEIKPGLGGWVCNFCKIRNPDNFSRRCEGCNNYKDDKVALGQNYWSCKSCNTANSDNIFRCEVCGEIKSDNMNFGYKFENRLKSEASKHEKWTCTKCLTQNSIILDKCSNCRKAKNEEREEPDEEIFLKNGDWICSCKMINKKFNTSCQKCFNRRAVGTKIENLRDNNEIKEIKRVVIQKVPVRQVEEPRINEVIKKKCSKCNKELNIVECLFCKDISRIADKCRKCKNSMSTINKCSTCVSNEESIKKLNERQDYYSYLRNQK